MPSELNPHLLNLGLLAYCFSFIIDRNVAFQHGF